MPNRQYVGRGEPVNAYVIAMETAAAVRWRLSLQGSSPDGEALAGLSQG